MSQMKKKKKSAIAQLPGMLISLIAGGLCGYFAVDLAFSSIPEGMPPSGVLLRMVGLLLLLYLAVLLQIIIHEAGHLLFGLFTGYHFSSFRIFNVILLREDGRLRLKRLHLAGTGGQCLMLPPESPDGKIPVILYNLGGAITNTLSALLFLGLYFLLNRQSLWAALPLFLAVSGFISAAANGIPMRMGQINNDGMNALELSRSPVAREYFRLQMLIQGKLAAGTRPRDMDESLFSFPSDEACGDSLAAAQAVFCCGRLLDQHRFSEADQQMEHLLTIESGLVGIHRNLLICDRIYVELISQNRPEALAAFLTKEQKKFMKSMSSFPSVIRTQYALALLSGGGPGEAEKIMARFRKCARSYPYSADIESEEELIEIASQKSRT